MAARLDEADAELREAIAELRELAHGIFPAVLADEGLAAAVEALAEDGRVSVRIRSLPEGRFAPGVETAAYTVVVEVARATTSGVVVEAKRSGDALLVDVEARRERARPRRPRGSPWCTRRPTRRRAPHGRQRHNPRRASVRIVIADDEMLLREGLAGCFQNRGFRSSARQRRPTSSADGSN